MAQKIINEMNTTVISLKLLFYSVHEFSASIRFC